MAEDLLIAKVGFAIQADQLRRRILRNQGNVVYDIYHVHYSYIPIDVLDVNDVGAMALSTRKQDQVNEDGVGSEIGFTLMVGEEGIFGVVALIADLETTGGVALIAAHDIAFSKPYTVPWLAGIFNVGVGTIANMGMEVYFTRRNVQPLEKASLVAKSFTKRPVS